MSAPVAEVRAAYDDQIVDAQRLAEQLRDRALAARTGYDAAISAGSDKDVLDDARFMKLRTAIDAAAGEHQVDMLLDQRAHATGRGRR